MIWTRTEANGKPMPLDAEPAFNGTFAIIQPKGGGDDPVSVHRSKADGYGAEKGPFYVSHFSTCPNAKEFRK